MSCRDIRDWLHRGADTLDEGQRLLLDDHLAACESCRGDRDRMRLLHEVGSSLPVPSAGAREYSRAIARALLEGPVRSSAEERRSRWIAPIAIAALAVATIVIVAQRGDEQPASPSEIAVPAPRPSPPLDPIRTVPTDMVEEGALIHESMTLTTGAAIPIDVPLRARERSRVRLASMHVVIAASSELRWSTVDHVLLLERGALDIETVGHDAARIVTSRFEVEIEDAALTVEPTQVRVRRGTARIVDRSRKVVAMLDQGATWAPVEPILKPAQTATTSPHASTKSAPELLAHARAQFAMRDYDGAERTAASVLAGVPTRSEQAEARIFLADVAQASGKLEVAVARYEAVAAKFSDLPAAESALYDAARIELRRARPAEARVLLDRYLIRYPSGRYADDAQRELAKLP